MILSIESSCDDSSIALTKIEDLTLVFHKKISQDEQHNKYGGVVPELAARLHAEALPNILEELKAYLPQVKAVCVTNEPGLVISLIEGVMMAKSLALALGVPLLAINHLKGHVYSLFIGREARFPLGVLLVSGGHTQILDVKSYDEMDILASTLDDSFGESFDKVAKMLGLGYPGGAAVEARAKSGDKTRFSFTIPLLKNPKAAFSYSGLKNQVRLSIQAFGEGITQKDKEDICASFQHTAIKHVIYQCEKVFKKRVFREFAVVGGASANQALRGELEKLCAKFGSKLHLASLEFCSDNAAMIGRAGIEAYKMKRFVDIDDILINPKSTLNL
jgi:N6-L-threonylcarbamoyladenine synthase